MAAIYMWRQGETIVITTTPYPIEGVEAVEVGASAGPGNMGPIISDDVAPQMVTPVAMTYDQLRWFLNDGPYDDDVAPQMVTPVAMTYDQLRWFLEDGPYDDATAPQMVQPVAMTYEAKLVYADSPDEELEVSGSASSASSMTAV